MVLKKEANSSDSISDQTYQQLEAMILSKEFGPGHVLEERPLSKILQVSRTPIRMALSRLLGEGLIVRLSNGLHAVNKIDVQDYLQLLQLRQLLEGEAAALAAETMPKAKVKELRSRVADLAKDKKPTVQEHWEIDDDFHSSIASSGGNPWLERMIGDVRKRVRMCNIQRIPDRLQETCKEHLNILTAIESGDPAAARKAMDEHLSAVRAGFLKLFDVNR